MEIEILSKQENKLLNREEIRFVVRFEKGTTPVRDAVREELQRLLKVKEGVVVIDHMKTEFGRRQARGYAKLYPTLEDATRWERKHVLVRNKLVETES
jgi:small subunit ribosomal protein S24e